MWFVSLPACPWVQAHPDNPLLQVRGQAGTHDIELARQTLEQLKSATSESSEVAVVRYDKSAHEGRGDRAPPSKWQQVKGKVDVVLFEGWMLGFKPLTDQAAEKVILVDPLHACSCSMFVTKCCWTNHDLAGNESHVQIIRFSPPQASVLAIMVLAVSCMCGNI